MQVLTRVVVGSSIFLCSAALVTGAYAYGRTQTSAPKPVAKVTPVQAMQAAEAKTGGKAGMAVFEFDEGHWVYGVIITKNHKLIEVDVDPVSGKAGATEEATPDAEAKELKDALTKMQK